MTVAVAILVVSVLPVAVMVAEAVVTGVGAVYTPPEVIEPTEAAQVTPALAPSLVTVAANVWVAPATSVAVVGLTVIEMGVRVIVADMDFDESVLLVAVTVAEAVVTGEGAVYTPAEVMEPTEAVQATPALAESFVSVAVNVCAAPPMSVVDVGLRETLITGTAGVPLPPQPARKVNARKPGRRRANRRTFDIQWPYLY